MGEGCEFNAANQMRTGIPSLQAESCQELGLTGQWPLHVQASKEFLVTLLSPRENSVQKCSSATY